MALTLRAKTFLIIIAVITTVFVLVFIIVNSSLRVLFDQSEQEIVVQESLEKIATTMTEEIRRLRIEAQNNATWEAAYEFLQGDYEEFVLDSMYYTEALAEFDIDRMLYFNKALAEDASFWRDSYQHLPTLTLDQFSFVDSIDPPYPDEVRQADELFIQQFLDQAIYYDDGERILVDVAVTANGDGQRPSLSLIELFPKVEKIMIPPYRPDNDENGLAGLLLVEEGPMLFASVPVLNATEDGAEGPAVGTLIVGRHIDQDYLIDLTRKLNLDVKIHLIDEDPELMAAKGVPEDVASLADDWDFRVKQSDNDSLVGYTLMHDINQNPALIWEMSIPLPKLDFAQKAIDRMYIVLIIIAVVFLILSLLLLEFLVLHPVGKLERGVQRIGLGGDLSNRLKVEGSDELARLALKINQMLQALTDALKREKELKKREKQLTQELSALRIEIDHSKKKQQVEEITGTSYFQQLQERAKAMRKRKSS